MNRLRYGIKRIKGTTTDIEAGMLAFLTQMCDEHDTFRVVATTAVQLMDGTVMFITYAI